MRTIFCTLLFVVSSICLNAQNVLPQHNGFSLGGAILTAVSEGENDYMDITGTPLCYMLEGDYRHYFSPSVAVGGTYEFMRSSQNNNQMLCHYLAPTLTLRVLTNDDRRGIFLTGGAGLFYYNEKLNRNTSRSTYFGKGYFAVNLALGYEFMIAKGLSMQAKLELLMADWHFNPDYTPKWNREEDDDDIQTIFENKFTYISLGVSLQFGK